MKITAPPQADVHLGEIMRQLDIGDELFWIPERLAQFEHWVGHIPFAFWLVKTLRPRKIVELGTHRGNSYCAFCQAIARLQLNAQAFAVDTWKGDIHMDSETGVLEDLRAYHDPRFREFSTLLQMTFDDAREMIENGSIDLLHIDGTHTYEAVKHDFENWKSTLSSRAVVLLHDICVRRDKYGVWRLWNELSARHPSFEFRHSFGLGVLGVGEDFPLTLRNLFAMSKDDRGARTVRALFASSGDAHVRTLAVSQLELDLKAERDDAARREAALKYWQDWTKAECDRLKQDLKAERCNAASRDAALQALVDAERDAAHRSAAQLHAFTTSTVWRATWPIRRVIAAIPAPIRRFARRALTFCWWVATLRLPNKLAERRERTPPTEPSRHDYSHLRPTFDEDWYDRTYELKDAELHGFAHYLIEGAHRGYSPQANFDEAFYLAFYRDVRLAISSGVYLCGYEHYVLAGRTENRLTKPVLTKTLNLKHPGLTDPIGIPLARTIERRLAPIAACSGGDEQSYWILVPTLDPDIFFGGYKALIEFIVALVSLKRPITVVTCDQDDDGSYFRYWITRQTRIAVAFETVRIVNGRNLTAPLRLSPTDKIFAYSAWEAHLAHHMAAHVKGGLFAWLVQEYEPIFHDYSAEHAITASAYQLPHYPLFNSTELKDYFQRHRLGIFSGDRLPLPRRDFAVFEHVLTKLSAPTLADLKRRPSRTLIFYARPEVHAKRNLFPLGLIALEEMAQQGSFVGPWEFHGVGALTEMTIPLGSGHELNLHAKMTEVEYDAFMHKVDVGLSLMYAPHPGLVAFEMASVGARVVTNTFENRSETYLRGLSENIIPCEPTISGIKQALTEAIESLHDFSGRIRGMRINRSQGVKSWCEVFNDDFFHREMAGFLETDQQTVSEKTS
jgi:hypothetical protein